LKRSSFPIHNEKTGWHKMDPAPDDGWFPLKVTQEPLGGRKEASRNFSENKKSTQVTEVIQGVKRASWRPENDAGKRGAHARTGGRERESTSVGAKNEGNREGKEWGRGSDISLMQD